MRPVKLSGREYIRLTSMVESTSCTLTIPCAAIDCAVLLSGGVAGCSIVSSGAACLPSTASSCARTVLTDVPVHAIRNAAAKSIFFIGLSFMGF